MSLYKINSETGLFIVCSFNIKDVPSLLLWTDRDMFSFLSEPDLFTLLD